MKRVPPTPEPAHISMRDWVLAVLDEKARRHAAEVPPELGDRMAAMEKAKGHPAVEPAAPHSRHKSNAGPTPTHVAPTLAAQGIDKNTAKAAMEKAKTGPPPEPGAPHSRSSSGPTPTRSAPTLADQGIDKHTANDARSAAAKGQHKTSNPRKGEKSGLPPREGTPKGKHSTHAATALATAAHGSRATAERAASREAARSREARP